MFWNNRSSKRKQRKRSSQVKFGNIGVNFALKVLNFMIPIPLNSYFDGGFTENKNFEFKAVFFMLAYCYCDFDFLRTQKMVILLP